VELNRKTVRTIVYLITFAILLNVVVHNLNGMRRWATSAVGMLAPIIIGFAIAFVINIPVSVIERNLLKERKGRFFGLLHRFRRPISIAISFVVVIAILVTVVGIVVPQFTSALIGAISKLQPLVEQLRVYLTEYEDEAPELVRWINSFNINWDGIKNQITNSLKNGIVPAVNFVTTAATSVFGTTTNLILGIILSINVLSIKEKLARQAKSVVRAYIKGERAERIIEIGRMTQGMFTSFIGGQITEALILAGLCYVGMLIFRFPYAFLISVVVGVTAMVPIFGAWAATGIGAILILTVKPVMALWFVVFFVILQQIEGNMIYPRVVGTKVGLPAMWVLIAITIGGGTMGVSGMLLSVPTCAVVYTLIRESVKKRTGEKGEVETAAVELPAEAPAEVVQTTLTEPAEKKGLTGQSAKRGSSKKRR